MGEDAGETVTIRNSEYDALLADRECYSAMRDILCHLVDGLLKRSPEAARASAPVLPNPGGGGISPIDRDSELAAFIRPLLGKETLKRIVALCEARFGPDRTPSVSAIHRFWQRSNRLKGHLEQPSNPVSNAA